MYKEKDLANLFLTFLLVLKLCHGWNLPPVQFLSQFATINDRTQLSVSVPSDMTLKTMNSYYKELARSVYAYLARLLTLFENVPFQHHWNANFILVFWEKWKEYECFKGSTRPDCVCTR